MRYTGIGGEACELALQFRLVQVVTHHDERAANALERLVDVSRIIQVTLHNLLYTEIEGHLLGVSDQGSKRYIRSRQRLGSCGTNAPGRAHQ